jgi:hypothetical protein
MSSWRGGQWRSQSCAAAGVCRFVAAQGQHRPVAADIWCHSTAAGGNATHLQELGVHALDQLLLLEAPHTLCHIARCDAVVPGLQLLQHVRVEVLRRRWLLLLQPPAVVVPRRVEPGSDPPSRVRGRGHTVRWAASLAGAELHAQVALRQPLPTRPCTRTCRLGCAAAG